MNTGTRTSNDKLQPAASEFCKSYMTFRTLLKTCFPFLIVEIGYLHFEDVRLHYGLILAGTTSKEGRRAVLAP